MKSYYYGMRSWLLQRVTALYVLGFIVYLAAHTLLARPMSFARWQDWVLSTGPRIATLLFFAALALHAWVGLRDISIDYIKPLALRLVVQSLIATALLAVFLWAAIVLFG